MPPHIIREVRENARAVKVELAGEAEQLPLLVAIASKKPAAVDLWEHQDRRFDALLAEFGIPIDTPKPAKRRVA